MIRGSIHDLRTAAWARVSADDVRRRTDDETVQIVRWASDGGLRSYLILGSGGSLFGVFFRRLSDDEVQAWREHLATMFRNRRYF